MSALVGRAARAVVGRAARAVVGRALRRSRVAALVAIVAAGYPSPAAAGTFEVSQCAAWNGSAWSPRTMQQALWSPQGGYLTSTCGTPGGRITLVPPNFRLPIYGSAAARLFIPAGRPHTTIRSLWLDWTSVPQAPSVDPAYAHVDSGGAVLLDVPAGWATHAGSADRFVPPSGARSLSLALWCSPAFGLGWCNWSSAPIEIRGLTLELEENAPPTVSASGALLDGTAQAGRTTLVVRATDGDSGVRRIDATLGATRIASVDLGPVCADDRLPTCPTDVRRTIAVDASHLPPGAARLRLDAVDAAGNEVNEDAGLVRIADRTPSPTPTPTPALTPAPSPPASSPPATGPPAPIADDARIAAHLESGGRHGRRLTIGARGHARIRGRLSRASGVPIGGATLTVLARRGERGWHAAGVTRTRADGRFTAPLAAGPSRRLTVAFERRRSVPMRLDVRAWVRLVVELRRGQRVLAGRLARPVPPGGAFVTVQRRVRGRWATAWRLRTSPTGRFAWRAPRGPATVRARVPTEPGYPYATGWSHAVRLR